MKKNINLAPQEMYDGLKRKYIVLKSDTGEAVEDCFVLRPQIDEAAIAALKAYAETTKNTQLAADIIQWINDIEKSFLTLTAEIDSKKAQLLKNNYAQTNASIYETLAEIGRLTAERDRIYGDDTTEVCFILTDNEFFYEVAGFLGDDAGFSDINGTPLHIGDTVHFQSGVNSGYDRLVLNRLVTSDMVTRFDAIKSADASQYELKDTFNAGFTVEVIDCKSVLAKLEKANKQAAKQRPNKENIER